jgi:hypothetical protein
MAQVLKQGSTGPDVKQVQQSLNKVAGSKLPKLVEDAVFGPKTRARVVEFQKSRGILADGIVGLQTRAALAASGALAAVGRGVAGVGKSLATGGAGIGDADKIANAVVNATRTAHLHGWKPQARFQGIRITGVTAIGTPGCLSGPDLAGLILGQAQVASLLGDDRLVATAAAKGIGAKFAAWQHGVSVPGLPWYPSFAAFPGPMAPPTPNVPSPLAAMPSSGTGGLISAASLQQAMTAALDPAVKARDPSGKAAKIFGTIAAQVAAYFSTWLTGQIVSNVLGHGPIPTFVPPVSVVGPVVNGSILPGGPHLA